MSIINYIKKYRRKKRVLFTTPSHSQGGFYAPETKEMLGEKVFSCDYSEIEGFDNLAAPSGIIKAAQDKAAHIYGAKASFFLTNGSTSGIIAAMLAVLNRNDKVIIARNCHRAVYNGLVLSGAVPVWLMPVFNSDWGIYDSLNITCLDELLSKNKDVKAVIITNPSYEGVIFDTARISALCRKYNAKLIVDEAHGALWNFDKNLGVPAVLNGADIAVQSLHKTMGALNPSAIMHIGRNSAVKPQSVQQALNLITTSSPSYPLLLNIEAVIDYLSSKQGASYIQTYIKDINKLTASLKKIPNLEIYSGSSDITKILVKVTNMPGFELSSIMFGKYGIEDELANEKSVLYLTGIGTDHYKLKKLEKALYSVCASNIKLAAAKHSKYELIYGLEPRVRYSPAAVRGRETEDIDLNCAVSRVSMELTADYPPGIPVLIPGEVIKKEHIEYLADKKKKIKVLRQGL